MDTCAVLMMGNCCHQQLPATDDSKQSNMKIFKLKSKTKMKIIDFPYKIFFTSYFTMTYLGISSSKISSFT